MEIQKVKQLPDNFVVNGTIFVPNDPLNSYYQQIQDWVKKGGIIEPFDFLQKAKEAKIAEIRAIKETELYKPVSYMGKVFAASERASGNITASLVLNGETVQWLDVDGNPVSMTRAEFQGLGIAIKNQRSLVYFKESQKYTAIEMATTIEQVNAIAW